MRQKKWDGSSISDQEDRVVIVTGASSGIGYETARVLADKNATVIIAVRSLEKGNAAANNIKADHNNADLRVMELDLACLESVKTFADQFRRDYSRLDLLINNAGVMIPPYAKTADGFELQLGTNHLGHFALTGLLLDVITGTTDSRIVNVSSDAHRYGKLDFADLTWEKRAYKAWRAYGDSKIANLYFTYQLGKKLAEKSHRTIVAASHPGWTATELQRHSGLFRFFNRFFAQDIAMGALPTLYAAVGPQVDSGDYFGPAGFKEMRGYPKKTESNRLSHDQAIAKRLWEVSEELTGVVYS
jgi:NAD(P)-dependent dehydrogenase (short-subunit alcohol dehydrogenase family)